MHTPQHHMPSGAAPPGCSSCPRAASSASSPRGRGFEHTAHMLLASSFSSVQCGHSHSVVGPPASPSPAMVATTPRGLSASVEARTKPSAPKDASARDPARRAPRCRATRRLPPRLRANYLARSRRRPRTSSRRRTPRAPRCLTSTRTGRRRLRCQTRSPRSSAFLRSDSSAGTPRLRFAQTFHVRRAIFFTDCLLV